MRDRNLNRSQSDTVVAGVCGGLGDYLNVDPILFRVLFVLGFLVGGSGLLVYIILWIAIPLEVQPINTNTNFNDKTMNEDQSNTEQKTNPEMNSKKPQKNDGNLWGGLILITLGGLFLIDRFVPRIDFGDLWPVILIVVGVILISKAYQNPKQ